MVFYAHAFASRLRPPGSRLTPQQGFRIEYGKTVHSLCPRAASSPSAIVAGQGGHRRSPNWHRRARKLRSKLRQRVQSLRRAGSQPWVRDICFLRSHHSRPFENVSIFMGKQGRKWHGSQAPWKEGKDGNQQDSNWSYWSGSWRTRQQKDQPQQEKTTLQLFPDYNKMKLQDGQNSLRALETAMEVSDPEDLTEQDFVKCLQKLLNAARKADSRLRKLEQDKEHKSTQWEEFQAALKAKFVEQRALFQREMGISTRRQWL